MLAAQAQLSEGRSRAERLLAAADAYEAAGEQGAALEALAGAHAAAADVLPARVLAERFTRLGDAARAVEVGFAAALDAGELTLALQLAERADDAARVRAAHWALALHPESSEQAVETLAQALQAEGDAAGLLRLAGELAPAHAARAQALRTQVLLDARATLARGQGPHLREQRLVQHGQLREVRLQPQRQALALEQRRERLLAQRQRRLRVQQHLRAQRLGPHRVRRGQLAREPQQPA